MTINERAAYLKGLMEGMKLDTETNEGKLLAAVVEAIGDICVAVTDVELATTAICDELDEIHDGLDEMVEELYSLFDDEDDDDDDFDFDFDDDDDVYYSVKCPSCEEEITIDSDILDAGGIKCPACGEELEFEIDDDCDCGHC